MKTGKRLLSIFLCMAFLCSFFPGCGGKKEEGGKQEGTTASGREIEFNMSIGSNTMTGITFDPAVDYQSQKTAAMGIAETLFVLNDETKEVEPHLATDIKQTDDLTWVITIRDGVAFSNGKALDAAACKSALEYIFANNTRLGTLADVASIEADGQTLTIKTNGIVAIMPRILTEVNTIIFDTEASEDYANGVIGTGAYILEQVDNDGNCELVRNENYWQGTPAAARIHAKANLEASAETLALQSGELDWAEVQAADLPLFENNPEYEVLSWNNGRVYYLYLNPEFTFTEDPALRKALLRAFDREAILQGVYGGRGSVTTSIFPEFSEFYDGSMGQVPYDLEQAKQILADAGYMDTDGDGFIEKDGEKVHLNITCYSSNHFPVLSEVLQSMLKAVGIDSDIVVSDAIVDDLSKGNYNIATYAYNTLTLGDCYNYLEPVFRTGGTSNFTGFSDEEVDGWLDEMKVTSDPGKRAELAKKIQAKVYEADQHMFLLHIERYKVVRKGITGITPMFDTDNANNFILWQFNKDE